MAKSNKRYGVDLNIAGETEAATDVPQEFIGAVAAGWGAIATATPMVFLIALGKITGFLPRYFMVAKYGEFMEEDGITGFLVQFAMFPFLVLLLAMWVFCLFGPAIALFTWAVKLTNAKRGIFDMLAWVLALWTTLFLVFWFSSNGSFYVSGFLTTILSAASLSPFFALGGLIYANKQQKLNRALDVQDFPLDIT